MPRDISGVYTLPIGNPVIPGTVIDTAWANPTMTDIATQLNNVITRDGLLGYTAPAKFIDGSQVAPAIAFASEGGLGFYRKTLNTLGVVSNNQEVALFKDTQINFQKNVALAGTLSVAGAVAFTGDSLAVAKPLLAPTSIGKFISVGNDLNDGTVASNSTIVAESQFRNANMQIRMPATGIGGFSFQDLAGTLIGGTYLDRATAALQLRNTTGVMLSFATATGAMTLSAPTPANSHVINTADGSLSLLVRGATMGIRYGFGVSGSIMEGVDNTGVGSFQPLVIGGLALTLQTSGVTRLSVGSAGTVTLATTLQMSANQILGVANIGGVADSSGYSIWGGGSVLNGSFLQLFGTAHPTGGALIFGTASTERMRIDSAGRVGMMIAPITASSFLQLKGDLSLMQANSAVFWNNYFDGANFRTATAGSSMIIKSGGAANNQLQMFGANDAAAGAAISPVVIYTVDGLVHFFKTPVYQGGAGGSDFGIIWNIFARTDQNNLTSIGVGNNASGANAGAAVRILGSANNYMQTFVLDNGGGGAQIAESQFGSATFGYRFLFNGLETVRFKPGGSTDVVTITDTGGAGVNIKMVGNGATTPKKYIRVSGGVFEVINDAYSAAIFSITDAGQLTLTAGLFIYSLGGGGIRAVANDVLSAANHAVGAIIIGSLTAGHNLNFGATFTANGTTNVITAFAMGSGTNGSITSGDWRICGALSSSSQVCLMIRVA